MLLKQVTWLRISPSWSQAGLSFESWFPISKKERKLSTGLDPPYTDLLNSLDEAARQHGVGRGEMEPVAAELLCSQGGRRGLGNGTGLHSGPSTPHGFHSLCARLLGGVCG